MASRADAGANVHVSVASNIDPARNVRAALARLAQLEGSTVSAVSPFFETAPIGRPEQGAYWNGVAALTTRHSRPRLTEQLQAIETGLGRMRGPDAYAARTIDLDVLLWNGAPAGLAQEAEMADRPWLCWSLVAMGAALPVCDDAPPAPPPVGTPWPL